VGEVPADESGAAKYAKGLGHVLYACPWPAAYSSAWSLRMRHAV
jgi:hypothetical protein